MPSDRSRVTRPSLHELSSRRGSQPARFIASSANGAGLLSNRDRLRDIRGRFRDTGDRLRDTKHPFRDTGGRFRDRKHPFRDTGDRFRDTKHPFRDTEDRFRDTNPPFRDTRTALVHLRMNTGAGASTSFGFFFRSAIVR